MSEPRPFSLVLNIGNPMGRLSHSTHGFRTEEVPSQIKRRIELMLMRFYDVDRFRFVWGANKGGYPAMEIEWILMNSEFSPLRSLQLWARLVRAAEFRHEYI